MRLEKIEEYTSPNSDFQVNILLVKYGQTQNGQT